MKFIKYLLFFLMIAIIGMAIYVAVQANKFKVEESTVINAPRAVVYELLSDTLSDRFSSSWSKDQFLVSNELFPKDSINQIFSSKSVKNSSLKWVLKDTPNGATSVTRILTADHLSFMTKAKHAIFGNPEAEQMEEFGQQLKTLSQEVTRSMAEYSITINGITQHGGGFYLYKSTSSSANNKPSTMAQQFAEIKAFMDQHRITSSGHRFTIYIATDPTNDNVIMSNAVPVSDQVIVADDSNILSGYQERSATVKATLKGNYSNLKEAWAKLRTYMVDQQLEASDLSPFEVYKNDPAMYPNPAQWITEIYIPIKQTVDSSGNTSVQ